MKTATQLRLTFDGFGINGGDEYMSRIATFTEHGHSLKIGPLLAAAPELLEACGELVRCLEAEGDETRTDEIQMGRAAIAKAEAQ